LQLSLGRKIFFVKKKKNTIVREVYVIIWIAEDNCGPKPGGRMKRSGASPRAPPLQSLPPALHVSGSGHDLLTLEALLR
jgi:hypothetical protein